MQAGQGRLQIRVLPVRTPTGLIFSAIQVPISNIIADSQTSDVQSTTGTIEEPQTEEDCVNVDPKIAQNRRMYMNVRYTNLKPRDLEAAKIELSGGSVGTRPDGRPWDHITEVRNGQKSLTNIVVQLKSLSSVPNLCPGQRSKINELLSEISSFLDYTYGYVPPS